MKHTNSASRLSTRPWLALGTLSALLAGAALAQTPARTETNVVDRVKAEPTEPPPSTDANGKPLPVRGEVRVLADPDTKLYMPCRGKDDLRASDSNPDNFKPNPKATVITEESAKQHGFKASAHKVTCPETAGR